MKGFKNSTRMQQGFNFPQQPTQLVSHYTRNRPMAKAKGGPVTQTVGDQGNSVTQRGNPPITTLDAQHGGKTPLRPGFSEGGKAKPKSPPPEKAKPVTGAAVTPEELAKLRAADKNPRYVPPKAPLAKGGKVKGSKVLLPKELTDSKKDHIGVVQKEHGAEIQVSMGRDKVTVPKNEVKETKLATGGVVAYAKGGDVAQDKKMIKEALNKHVAAPRPRGHGVK